MIEVEHLTKVYGSTAALQDVSFSVKKGEILGFLGPNGAGKTTTMRILTGYLPATSGTAKVAGSEVHQDSMAVRRQIGYLPENPPLYRDMTVERFLRFVAAIKGVEPSQRTQRVNTTLEICNLTEKCHTVIRKLSKGFRQRVGLAQAIVHDPPVIILDEPTVGLDPKQIIDVRNLIKSLAKNHTIILSTHILAEANMLCDRITIINQGRIVATGTPDQLTKQLSEGVAYDLEVGGPLQQIEQMLQSVSGVASVELLHQIAADRFQMRVITNTPQENLGRDLSVALIRSNLDLYQIQRQQATLEYLFLELTEKSTSDEVPSETSSVARSHQPEAGSKAT
jgi:ABC-2 type transport system ATP-binding protein